jgi:hypothetical protein
VEPVRRITSKKLRYPGLVYFGIGEKLVDTLKANGLVARRRLSPIRCHRVD